MSIAYLSSSDSESEVNTGHEEREEFPMQSKLASIFVEDQERALRFYTA